MSETCEAIAHPNIALVKYWGKQDKPGNLPAMPNLSITLDTLVTRTRVAWADRDELWLDGRPTRDAKVTDFLAAARREYDIPPVRIDSENNFPTGAGLASSASGFAALTCALNELADLGKGTEALSAWARTGSASAARSLLGGFVSLVPPQWTAQQLATQDHWPLTVVVAVVSSERKITPSTEGMHISRRTSPFYDAWTRDAAEDFAQASEAIQGRDFAALAEVSEASCMKMHGVMLTSSPTLVYWCGATLDCLATVQDMRRSGVPVFFTIDAGPQVKAICEAGAVDHVTNTLTAVPGVQRTIACGLGDGARLA